MKVRIEQLDLNRKPIQITSYFNVHHINGTNNDLVIYFADERNDAYIQLEESMCWFIEDEI